MANCCQQFLKPPGSYTRISTVCIFEHHFHSSSMWQIALNRAAFLDFFNVNSASSCSLSRRLHWNIWGMYNNYCRLVFPQKCPNLKSKDSATFCYSAHVLRITQCIDQTERARIQQQHYLYLHLSSLRSVAQIAALRFP